MKADMKEWSAAGTTPTHLAATFRTEGRRCRSEATGSDQTIQQQSESGPTGFVNSEWVKRSSDCSTSQTPILSQTDYRKKAWG